MLGGKTDMASEKSVIAHLPSAMSHAAGTASGALMVSVFRRPTNSDAVVGRLDIAFQDARGIASYE